MTNSLLTFLYIEDDPLSRQIMSFFLINMMGYSQLIVWEDSARFAERFDELALKPDIIFLDIHVEPLNGFEMLNIIRQRKHFLSTPVIALTASVMSEEVGMLKKAGFSGAVAKPVNMDTFPETLNRILKGEAVWRIS